ncbi:hypothetical protein [Paenibacillus lutimineralis]|uniref:Uncharacterized protein n=1 Tax=Paenibacillus lutimineralis TaxID=2707005 RepID=A0A3Q9IBV1_9BACL|nr:hypothetical protein [Paenibacillus lutimineralis]AZS14752.1 hypothetical protein EI981_09955 [Paenibacillus lutimineralis]
MLEETKEIQAKLEHYRDMLGHLDVTDSNKQWIGELIDQLHQLEEENKRLKKTILRISAKHNPRMSTKLKDALYE